MRIKLIYITNWKVWVIMVPFVIILALNVALDPWGFEKMVIAFLVVFMLLLAEILHKLEEGFR